MREYPILVLSLLHLRLLVTRMCFTHNVQSPVADLEEAVSATEVGLAEDLQPARGYLIDEKLFCSKDRFELQAHYTTR